MKINVQYLTPKQIVEELNKYIVGQEKAKRAVAIALRNRWRRLNAPENMRNEIVSNNILMIGPTGVGKTEIARRLANLVGAPFIKVEATRYTEIGYVGKDVESIIRDLLNVAINMVKQEKLREISDKARKIAEDRVIDLLFPGIEIPDTREKIRDALKQGYYNNHYVDVIVEKPVLPFVEVIGPSGWGDEFNIPIPEGLEFLFPKSKKQKRMTVSEAIKTFENEESQKLINMDEVIEEAINRTETLGIVFIDEIDKIIGSRLPHHGPDVSREGVQRDLLPIIEGTTVQTKYGMVKTDHILFIAAGAFHHASPQDLLPEFQGRFPIRVELNPLTEEDFYRILIEPQNALTKQYKALLSSEGVELDFTDSAMRKVAHYAYIVNQKTENIGARRLHTIMSLLLEDILFELPEAGISQFIVDEKYVDEKLKHVVEDVDISRYIL